MIMPCKLRLLSFPCLHRGDVEKQHVNKKKAIKSKSRHSIFQPKLEKFDTFAELEFELELK